MDGQTCRGQYLIMRERWPSVSLSYQEEPKPCVLKVFQKSAESSSALIPAFSAPLIPVGLGRMMFVALTNINLQSPGCNFTLCCVHKLISWDLILCFSNTPEALYLHINNKRIKVRQVLTTFNNIQNTV